MSTGYSSLEIGTENDRLNNYENCNSFSHFDEDELTCPPAGGSIYSAAVISTLGVSHQDVGSFGGFVKAFVVISPAWVALLMNLLASLFIIANIRDIRDETPVCEANFNLLLLGVAIFNVYNCGEIFETVELAFWIQGFKTVSNHEQLTFATKNGEPSIVSGLTPIFKVICVLFIVLPKLMIGLLLAYYGSGFLLVSDDNESLILNTVALTFITQIDELIFVAMTPLNVKMILDELPPFPITYGYKMIGLARPYIVSLGIAVIAYFSYLDSCKDTSGAPSLIPTHMPGGKGKHGNFYY